MWLASVRDAFSSKVVGWRCGPRPDTDLVLSVLDYALFSRDVRAAESQFSTAARGADVRRLGSPSGSSTGHRPVDRKCR